MNGVIPAAARGASAMGADVLPETALGRLLASRRRPDTPVDVERMGRERWARLQAEVARAGVDVAVLLHAPHVAYATGQPVRGVDVTVAVHERPVAVVVAGAARPHLLGGATAGPDVEAHPAVWPETDEGAADLGRALAAIAGPLAGRRVAVDEQTGAMLRAGVLAGAEVVDAAHLVGAAKLTKTPDELGCIAEAQRRNEAAMVAVEAAVRPGVTRAELAGLFLAELAARGVDANMIDPIFERMPRRVAEGPRTTTGGVSFPTGIPDVTFGAGDVVWVDTGVDHLGYASDFGRTWLVGRDPTPAERDLFAGWCAVMEAVLALVRPGATGGDLCRAATAVGVDAGPGSAGRPWLAHFYLAHGVGIESAEMPLLGTDLGPDFDDGLVLASGMVLVLEPVVWVEGVGGYRAEEIVVVTDDAWAHLGSGHPYGSFGG
jgi:Xaa-Pro aminopeptidase